jgi:chromosome partitioning protein
VIPLKTLAILSQKGGSGKTTLAVHLAVAAELRRRSAAVIDLDPQGSASVWKDLRGDAAPVVVAAQPVRLAVVLLAVAESGRTLAIIDTAPHADAPAVAAARTADLILIPCRPAPFDLRAIETTVDLAKRMDRPAVIVLNAVPPRGRGGDSAAEALSEYGLPIAPVRLSQRAAFQHALIDGRTAQEWEPDGAAAKEAIELYNCIHVRLHKGT